MQAISTPIFVNPSPADSLPVQYARVTFPLDKGAAESMPDVTIKTAKGEFLPVQSELLASWPDGSPRALHLTFPAAGGTYEATVQHAGSSSGPASKDAIWLEQHPEGSVTVTTGRLSATVGGVGLVESIRLNGREMIGAGGIDVRVLDERERYFTATAATVVETEIETAGPLRTIVAVKGKCTLAGTSVEGELPEETFLNFRLRFEFLAGVEGFGLAYTFHNLERGRDYFNVQAIELDLKLSATGQALHTIYQRSHGLFSTEGRMVTTPEPLHIAVDFEKARTHITNFEALSDATTYPFYLNPPPDVVSTWAAVSDGDRSLQVEMENIEMMRPKSLDVVGHSARFGVWPREAGMLELQQGRSRQVTVFVALSDSGPPANYGEGATRTAQLADVWRAQLPQETYAAANFFDQARVLPFDPGKHPRFENWLSTMAFGLNTVTNFFDFGDTPDSGYQRTYIPLGGRIRRIRGEDGGPRYFEAAMHYPATHLNNLDDFEPVWVNNEYDVIWAIGTEYLRTNNMAMFRKLCWFSRHTIDVDFLHYSDHKWLNRAQPAHSERHTTTGAYPSHFWSQGLAQYYMLTGDPDALEVIIALADKTIENLDDSIGGVLHHGLNREIGWGILTMICAYEASGIERFDAYARELIDREIALGLPHDLPVFSFGHTSILLGTREYLQIHAGDPNAEPVRRWLLEFVDLAIRCSREAPPETEEEAPKVSGTYSYDQEFVKKGKAHSAKARSGMFSTHSIALDPLAYAYEITGDEKYIAAGRRTLEFLVDSPAFRTPPHEGKPFAMVNRTFINYLKYAAELGYLVEYEYKH